MNVLTNEPNVNVDSGFGGFNSWISKKIKGKEKRVIFISAFLIRVIFGMIFFGAIDVFISVKDSPAMINGGQMSNLPYFPVIHLFLWLGGMLNLLTPLPVTFCQKLVPILFDSLIAVLIYDILKRKYPELSFKSAILYVLSPVALIQNSFHGQWDSICLFFLIFSFYVRDCFEEKRLKYFIFGVLFGLSFLVKPFTLVFILVFLKPLPSLKVNNIIIYIRNQLFGILGLLSVMLIFVGLFILIGYDIEGIISRVTYYSNKGFYIFGLPHSPPFNELVFLSSRFWLIGLIAFISIFYYIRKIGVFDVILLSFAFMIATCGLAPQYLIWLVPFLLLSKYNKLGALYNLISTLFLLVFYINPFLSAGENENMATFATLKSFNWLMPPSFLTNYKLTDYGRIIGDRMIPAVAFIIAVYMIARLCISIKNKNMVNVLDNQQPIKLSLFSNIYFLFNINFWIVIVSVFFLVRNLFNAQQLHDMCVNANNLKFEQYDMFMVTGNIFSGNYKEFSATSVFNIIFILFIGALIWSAYSTLMSFKQKYKEEV